MWRSVPQIPAARTAIFTCPGSGAGSSMSRTSTLPTPGAAFTTASISAHVLAQIPPRLAQRALASLQASFVRSIFRLDAHRAGITGVGQRREELSPANAPQPRQLGAVIGKWDGQDSHLIQAVLIQPRVL